MDDQVFLKKILIIDDDPDIQEILGIALSREGFQIEKAINGHQGLEILKKEPRPLAVLLDLMMPVMSGYEVLEQLSVADPSLRDVPLIILSAMPDADKVAELYSRRFLPKPINLDELCSLLESL
jgi:CheY-like chemotaxis protein